MTEEEIDSLKLGSVIMHNGRRRTVRGLRPMTSKPTGKKIGQIYVLKHIHFRAYVSIIMPLDRYQLLNNYELIKGEFDELSTEVDKLIAQSIIDIVPDPALELINISNLY